MLQSDQWASLISAPFLRHCQTHVCTSNVKAPMEEENRSLLKTKRPSIWSAALTWVLTLSIGFQEVQTHRTHPGTSCNKSKPRSSAIFHSVETSAFRSYCYITWKIWLQFNTILKHQSNWNFKVAEKRNKSICVWGSQKISGLCHEQKPVCWQY